MRQGERMDLAQKSAVSQSAAAKLLNISRASVQRAATVESKGTPEEMPDSARGSCRPRGRRYDAMDGGSGFSIGGSPLPSCARPPGTVAVVVDLVADLHGTGMDIIPLVVAVRSV